MQYFVPHFLGGTLTIYHAAGYLSTTFFLTHSHIFDCSSGAADVIRVLRGTAERRRRDLNPRAAINDLHPFQGCPFGQLGYFSTMPDQSRTVFNFEGSFVVYTSGEGGIRTHAPFRTYGFQDRLVMTTSIPLQSNGQRAFIELFSIQRIDNFIIFHHPSQHLF